jgi:hypothetical protein
LVLAFGSGGAGKVNAFSSKVSGGGVTTWHRAAGYFDTGDRQLAEIWYGIVTAARAATLTISNSSAAAEWNRLSAEEFTASGANLSWTVLTASQGSLAKGSSVTYPSLTGSGLYFGVAESSYGDLQAGKAPGFSYATIDTHLQTAVNVTAVNGIPTATSSNSGDHTVLVSVLFAVSGIPIALAVTTTSLPVGYTSQGYAASLVATGGTPPYAWSVASGSLPAGLVLGAGIITGSPKTSGTSNFTAKVTDNAGKSAAVALRVTVSPSPPLVYSSASYGAHYPDPHPPNPQITMPGVTDSGHGDYTDNNCWGQTGYQKLNVYSNTNWYIEANQAAGNSRVETFANTGLEGFHYAWDKWSAWTSGWDEYIDPDPSVIASGCYDIWFDTKITEVMIHFDLRNRGDGPFWATEVPFGGYTDPWGNRIPRTLWNVAYQRGYTSVFFNLVDADGNYQKMTTGAVDLLAMMKWLVTARIWTSYPTLNGWSLGYEVCSTGGVNRTLRYNNLWVKAR